MKDVQATLRRIDEQITAHTQSINRSRLEITRLQETRIVLMGLAEEDIITAEAERQHRLGGGMNGHAAPKLIVRPEGWNGLAGDEEDGSASAAAKYGLNKAGDTRGMHPKNREKRKSPLPNAQSGQGLFRIKVVKLLSDGEAMTYPEMARYFGLPSSVKARKPLQNAVYNMARAGQLHRDAERRYSLPKLSPPPA
jgi:hypothetical protein